MTTAALFPFRFVVGKEEARGKEEEYDEQSNTDTSEDSVEVSVTKSRRRKTADGRRRAASHRSDPESRLGEKRRRPSDELSPCRLAPKKRFMLEAIQDRLLDVEPLGFSAGRSSPPCPAPPAAPFRPWDLVTIPASRPAVGRLSPTIERRPSGAAVWLPDDDRPQEEPLALVVDKARDTETPAVVKSEPRSPAPCITSSPSEPETVPGLGLLHSPEARAKRSGGGGHHKNMSRDKRIEANARERQRVHTITAAFENLQSALPTADEDDGAAKLSKLSVIKIATAYILALSRMAGHDYSEDGSSAPPVHEAVANCRQVIHTETKTKLKRV